MDLELGDRGVLVRRRSIVAAVLAVVTSCLMSTTIAVGQASAATPGVTSKTITLGLITSLTGPSGPEDAGIIPAAQARIDEQNARGASTAARSSWSPRTIRPIPPRTRPPAPGLLRGCVRGDRPRAAVTFGGYKLLQQQGVPVTGGANDGPEWYEQPNTNMFSFSGPGDAKDPRSRSLRTSPRRTAGPTAAPSGTPSRHRHKPRPAGSSSPVSMPD